MTNINRIGLFLALKQMENEYMTKSLCILLTIVFVIFKTCCAEIIKTSDLDVIKGQLEQADDETLVIFDVDDVLLHPCDKILKMQNKKYLEETIQTELAKKFTQEQTRIIYSIIFQQRKNVPVDAKLVGLISDLQAKGIRVLALTNCFTGKWGLIDSMEDWRINELSRNGYNFAKSWGEVGPKIFDGLSKSGKGLSAKITSLATFKNGVVFSSGVNKGEALKAFLVYAKFMPKKIIFIDDKLKYLESVEKLASELKLPFVGVEYTAVADTVIEPLNKTRAYFQFAVLEKEHKWLSDAEADQRMEILSNNGSREY